MEKVLQKGQTDEFQYFKSVASATSFYIQVDAILSVEV